jgi:hypothetical protein
MKPTQSKKRISWSIAILLTALAVAGCRKTEQGPPPSGVTPSATSQVETKVPQPSPDKPIEPVAEKSAASKEASPSAEGKAEPPTKEAMDDLEDEPEDAPRDLGSPLVDDPKGLVQLAPASPAWVDAAHHRVVMVGEVCQRTAPLEMFACLRNTKEHESVVCVQTEAAKIHAALLAVGAEAGHPVSFQPKYVAAAGTEIEVTVHWKDAQGKVQHARAQDWVRNYDTKKAMDHPWVFGGSGFWTDERTGKRHYQAEGGDFICVSNFPSAMLDLPFQSSDRNDSLLFEAFTERIPPLGTPVTIVLTPKLAEKKETKPATKEPPAPKK